MKRLVVALLFVVLVFNVGVGATASGTEKIKLIGMCWGSTAQYEAMTQEIFATNPELAAKYEIEWVLGGDHDSSLAEKIRYGLSANEYVCDFAVLNYTQIPEFAREGVLVDISAALEPYQATMTAAAKELSQYEGQTIAVPFEVKTKVWYYRSDIFEACGVNAADIKDTDDFIAAGHKIQETYPDSYMWNLGRNVQGYTYYLTLSGNDASFFDADGNYNIATDAGTIAMIEDYKKMVDAGVVADISDWTPDWESALANGTVITQLSAGWLGQDIFLPTYSGPDNEWKVALWPVIGGTNEGSDAGGSVMVVPSFAKHSAEAAEFISYACLSEGGSMVVFNTNGSLPQNTAVLAQDDLFADQMDGYFGPSFVEAQAAAANKFKIFNYSPNASAEQNIVVEYFTKAIYGDLSIGDALTAAQNDLITMIGNAFN